MKNYRIITMLCMALLTMSCSDKDSDKSVSADLSSDNVLKGIFVYSESVDRGRDTLDVTFDNTLENVIFTTRALPMGTPVVDLTKVKIMVEVAKEATVNISPEQLYDITAPLTIAITAQNGDVRNYVVKVVVTPPYEVIPEYETTITPLWNKTGTQLALNFPKSCRDITVSGNYLLVLDNTIDYSANAKIKVYNRMTGEFIQDIPVYEGGWAGPRSYTWTLQSDDAGNFAMGRLNAGGAGFWLDVYNSNLTYIGSPFKMGAAQVPVNMGRRMQIMGNMVEGNYKIILSSGYCFGDQLNVGEFSSWTRKNDPVTWTGVVADLPITSNYNSVRWQAASVQQLSMDDPTLYITYNDETGYPNHPFDQWDQVCAAHFEVYNPTTGEPALVLNQANLMYRVIDSRVFTVKGNRYLFTLQQGYSTGTGEMKEILYNITGKSRFNITPESPSYNRFRIYQSEGHVVLNDYRYGNVAVCVDDDTNEAYMYTFYPGSDSSEAKITAVKMSLGEELK